MHLCYLLVLLEIIAISALSKFAGLTFWLLKLLTNIMFVHKREYKPGPYFIERFYRSFLLEGDALIGVKRIIGPRWDG